jgi:hydrogenase 3 maturation protease
MDAMKTLKSSWKEPLSQALRKSRKIAFVGVGQELRGDDAAGVLVIRRLAHLTAPGHTPRSGSGRKNPAKSRRQSQPPESQQREEPLLFEAGPLPEAAAGPLRRYQPDWVVLIDAADMGEAAGSIRWLDPLQVEGFSSSTHTIPLSGFARYLSSELGCRVAVLGIQSKNLEFDSPVSEEVLRAIEEMAASINNECAEKIRPSGNPIP